jgi:hypothetical protein
MTTMATLVAAAFAATARRCGTTARRGSSAARLSGTTAATIKEAERLDAGRTGQNHCSPEGQRNNKTTVHGETPYKRGTILDGQVVSRP